jgi:hypothetical protein
MIKSDLDVFRWWRIMKITNYIINACRLKDSDKANVEVFFFLDCPPKENSYLYPA